MRAGRWARSMSEGRLRMIFSESWICQTCYWTCCLAGSRSLYRQRQPRLPRSPLKQSRPVALCHHTLHHGRSKDRRGGVAERICASRLTFSISAHLYRGTSSSAFKQKGAAATRLLQYGDWSVERMRKESLLLRRTRFCLTKRLTRY